MKGDPPQQISLPQAGRWRRAVTVGMVVSLIAVTISACQWPWSEQSSSSVIELSGTVEARETDVAFQVPGRIAHVSVDEGDTVTVGEPVASLDISDYQLSLDRAQAEAAVSKAALALLEAGARHQEVKVAAAAVTQAEAQLKFARSETKRIEKLIPKKLAAQDQLDRARLQEDVAKAALTQAKQQLALIKEGARKEQIDEARANVEAREKAVAVAQQQLSYADLKSPVSGSVTVRLMEPGEVAAPGQAVLRIASLAHPWVRVYVNEKDLPRIKLGQAADVTVDGLPGKVFKGKVTFISPEAEFTPKTVETRDVRVDLVYRVKVEVSNVDGALKIGMPADVSLTPAAS